MDRDSLTRRQILGLAGLGSLSLAAGSAGLSQASLGGGARTKGDFDDGTDEIPGGLSGRPGRVIVIGAGFAGLAAANALSEAGVENVVLEARTRNGGRVHTRKVGDSPVDLGASWIHEPVNNPMSAYAAQAGIDRIPASPEADASTVLLFDGRSGAVSNEDKFAAFAAALGFDESRADLASRMGARASMEDGAGLFLDELALADGPRRWASFFIQTYAELEGAKDWSTQPLADRMPTRPVPVPNHLEYGGFGLGEFPEGGYSRLIKSLARGCDVRHGHRVLGISRTKKGVEVTVRRKRQKRSKVFRGTHVLVTVPLGVLKAGAIRFDPPLSKAKAAAIKRIGFGNFEKVALSFDRPFWEDDGSTHLLHVGSRNSGWFPMTIDLQRFCGVPTLVALNAGAVARRLSGTRPAQVRAEALGVLREAYGSDVPAPVDVAVSNWLGDPFSRGSYSATVMGTGPDDRAALADPAGRILFAGEATNFTGRAATTDGALSSGIREAKRLLRRPRVTLSS